MLAPLALGLGVWLIAGSLVDLAERLLLFAREPAASLSRLRRPAALGARHRCSRIAGSALTRDRHRLGERLSDGDDRGGAAGRDARRSRGYTLLFEGVAPRDRPELPRGARAVHSPRAAAASGIPARSGEALLSRRGRWPTTEAAIKTAGFSQLYVSLGDQAWTTARMAVRASYKPLVTLIWLGPLVMAIGGAAVALRPAAPHRRAAARAGARERTAPA